MDKSSRTSTLRSLKKEYRVGSSVASTKVALKQSMFNILNNQSVSRAIGRDSSLGKMNFYKDISKKNAAYVIDNQSLKKAVRPFSHYMSIRPQTALRSTLGDHEIVSATEYQSEVEVSLKHGNPNLAGHYERNVKQAPMKSFNRTQSAFNIRNMDYQRHSEKQMSHQKLQHPSIISFNNRNIQSAAPIAEQIIEEEHPYQLQSKSGSQIPNKSHSINKTEQSGDKASSEEIDSVKENFNKNPIGCLEDTLYKLNKCQEMIGEVKDENEKRKEALKRDQMIILTGNADGTHPWEHVSLYMEEEPEYNNPNYKGNYKRQPLFKIEATDEDEIRKLMEEAYERYDFYKKYTNIQYDQDFNFLKTTQARLTYTEITKIKEQFQSKNEGYELSNTEALLIGK